MLIMQSGLSIFVPLINLFANVLCKCWQFREAKSRANLQLVLLLMSISLPVYTYIRKGEELAATIFLTSSAVRLFTSLCDSPIAFLFLLRLERAHSIIFLLFSTRIC